MNVTLDRIAEKLIQREIDLGRYSQPAEVIAHALQLLSGESESLEEFKSRLETRLARSVAQIERGEGIPGEDLLSVLAARRHAIPPSR